MLVENYVELNFSQFANRKNGKYEINFIFLTNIFFLLSDPNLYVLFAPPLFHVDFLKDMGYRWIIHNFRSAWVSEKLMQAKNYFF